MRLQTPVDGIDTASGEVRLSHGERLSYDNLVVATGARANGLDVPGTDREGVFVLRNLEDAIAIKSYLAARPCRKAVILGAGFIAMEMAENFSARGMETIIVHRGELPVARWDPEFSKIIRDEVTARGVTFVTGAVTVAIEGAAASRLALVTDRGTFDADIILMALGIRPDATLAGEAGIELGKTGAVRVDYAQRTSSENVYAVGDCCEVYHRVAHEWVSMPLGDIANKQGRVAGSTIGGKPLTFPGIVGAQSFRVFGLEAAATGIDEEGAAGSGYDPGSTIVWGSPVVRVMNPENHRLGLKLVADRKTGKLLGAQAVGPEGAVSRINTLSACLWSGLDIDDVGYLDLAYAPPFSGAWDLIHMAAQQLRRTL